MTPTLAALGWIISDGVVLNGQGAQRSFESAGDYEILLTVSDSADRSGDITLVTHVTSASMEESVNNQMSQEQH